MSFLRNMFRSRDNSVLKSKIEDGALLLDVRTQEEYASGHVAGSLNIPLDDLTERMNELDKGRPIVAVCLSGARSAYAVKLLQSEGFEAYNGGGWQDF